MRRHAELMDPDKAVALSRDDLATVPKLPGLYAVWLIDSQAVRQCGVQGPAPLLVYVGMTGGRSGPRERLGRHVGYSWLDLAELLAARGNVLFPWWQRHHGARNRGWIVPTTPLAALCERQAVEWQTTNLRYTWMPLDVSTADLGLQERLIIESESPLLNRRGLEGSGPPQLRRMGRYKQARVRWLWQTSWAALLVGSSWSRDEEWLGPEATHPGVDGLAFPCPQAEAARVSTAALVPTPSLRELRTIMRRCARDADPDVRAAIDATRDKDELGAWWAAHAGAPFLAPAVSIEDSLTASLSTASEKDAPGPTDLPSARRIDELVSLMKRRSTERFIELTTARADHRLGSRRGGPLRLQTHGAPGGGACDHRAPRGIDDDADTE